MEILMEVQVKMMKLKINLIPKGFNHTVTKSVMPPLNYSVINNNE